jgi:hypothetical protein
MFSLTFVWTGGTVIWPSTGKAQPSVVFSPASRGEMGVDVIEETIINVG